MRAVARFGGAAVAIIGLLAWAMTLVWTDAAARRGVLVSAVIALVVQVITFVVARIAAPTNVMAGWGVGMLLRFITVVAYALVASRGLGLPVTPALISLVSFFFVTSLVEPVLLKT